MVVIKTEDKPAFYRNTLILIHHRLDDSDLLRNFSSVEPRFDLQKKANLDTFPVETEQGRFKTSVCWSGKTMRGVKGVA